MHNFVNRDGEACCKKGIDVIAIQLHTYFIHVCIYSVHDNYVSTQNYLRVALLQSCVLSEVVTSSPVYQLCKRQLTEQDNMKLTHRKEIQSEPCL